jgi:hypothetical protein
MNHCWSDMADASQRILLLTTVQDESDEDTDERSG